MRVVIDTNLLVTYLLTHRDPIATIIDHHLALGHFTLLSAAELLAELERVLAYPRLQRFYDDATRGEFAALIAQLGELQDLPQEIPRICRDPGDDIFIACAVTGEADLIVSGDKDLLALGAVGSIAIVTARQFLEILSASEFDSKDET
jgi:putative PIN family toxin of toxin-antitoxin system